MKIAIVCRPRTKSSAIQHTLSQRHNLIDLREYHINELKQIPRYKPTISKFRKVREGLEPYLDLFKQDVRYLTENLKNYNDFVLKIFPRMLVIPEFTIHENNTISSLKNKVLFDLSSTMCFDMYDKIYILDRDLYSSCASWVYSTHTHSFFVNKIDKNKQKQIILNEKDYNQLRFVVFENVLFGKLIEYFNKNNIHYENITEKTDEFIDKNIPMIESERVFPELILNYDDMCNYIDQYHQVCISETKDWQFL